MKFSIGKVFEVYKDKKDSLRRSDSLPSEDSKVACISRRYITKLDKYLQLHKCHFHFLTALSWHEADNYHHNQYSSHHRNSIKLDDIRAADIRVESQRKLTESLEAHR